MTGEGGETSRGPVLTPRVTVESPVLFMKVGLARSMNRVPALTLRGSLFSPGPDGEGDTVDPGVFSTKSALGLKDDFLQVFSTAENSPDGLESDDRKGTYSSWILPVAVIVGIGLTTYALYSVRSH